MLGKIVRAAAFASLLCAYLVGQLIKNENTTDLINHHFPGVAFQKVEWSRDAYRIISLKDGNPQGHLLVKSTDGWGGPALTAVQMSDEGQIIRAVVLTHRETPQFFRSMKDEGFFHQFAGMKVGEPLRVGQDVDAVSGATISSKSFTKAVRVGAHDLGTNLLHRDMPEPPVAWDMGTKEFILILLYAVIIISALKKYLKARKITLAFSIVFLGFYVGSSISISNYGALLLGYVPPLETQLFWWLLVLGSLILILIYGKNLYCFWMCPFGGIQEWIATIAGFRIKIAQRLIKPAEYGVLLLLWFSLMVMFLTTNPAMGMFEPFATLFSFKGSGVQWYLVSLSIFASFIIPRFWCRFFCPVGSALKLILKTRKKLLSGIKIWRT